MDNNADQETQKAKDEEKERRIVIGDIDVAISDLPEQVQALVQSYDIWLQDRADAQKKFAQLDSAVQHLAAQISKQVREFVEDQNEEKASSTQDDSNAEAKN